MPKEIKEKTIIKCDFCKNQARWCFLENGVGPRIYAVCKKHKILCQKK